jgi:hypothetical protein
MVARVDPLIQMGTSRGKEKAGVLEVTLPATCDEAMKRDGIDIKPVSGVGYGERQFWLLQMLSLVPPGHWSAKFAMTPGNLLLAIPKEYRDLLLSAWRAAAEASHDADWADALIRHVSTEKEAYLDRNLLALLPVLRRHDLAYDLMTKPDCSSHTLRALASNGPLDVRCARRMMEIISDRAAKSDNTRDYTLASLFAPLSQAVPPTLLSEFEAAWPAERFTFESKSYDQFFKTLTLRQQMHKEFFP